MAETHPTDAPRARVARYSGAPAEPARIVGPLETFVAPARYWRCFALLGLCVAVVSAGISLVLPQRFRASASFIPAPEDRPSLSSSGLAALAGQFGFSASALGTSSAQFYGDLIRSRSIIRKLLAAKVPAEGREALVIDLLDVHDKTPIRRLERAERRMLDRIHLRIDRTTNRIDMDVWMRHPETAKAVADTILALVNRFDREIRRTHASEKRAFAEQQWQSAADSLHAAEQAMADFLERNRSYEESAQLSFQHDRLARAITLRQDLYLSLAHQLQEARLEEVDTRPVLTIIDPPLLPGKRAWPKRAVFVLMSVLVIESLGWFLVVFREIVLPNGAIAEHSDLARALDLLRGVLRDARRRPSR